jgi:hypothetical protein
MKLVCHAKGRTQTGVFENRVLRRMFGPRRDEMKGCWKKIHNKVLHNLLYLEK